MVQECCTRCGDPIPRPLPKDAELLCDACFMHDELTECSLGKEDYSELKQGCWKEEDCPEEKRPAWPIRLLSFILSPFIAVAALIFMVAIFLLGFGFVIVGLRFLPENPVTGWTLFIFGIGIWLVMIFKGINSVFGGRDS